MNPVDFEARTKIIDEVLLKDRTNFEKWAADSTNQQKLYMPHQAARVLIPSRILELVKDPTRIDVRVSPKLQDNYLRAFVVEVKDQDVTNLKDLLDFRDRYYDQSLQREGRRLPYPPGLDMFHWEFIDQLEGGIMKPNEYVTNLMVLKGLGNDELFVVSYSDRKEYRGLGVASSFYMRLRDVARKLGFRYITGQNPSDNAADFFIKKLGRTPYDKLPKILRDHFNENHKGDLVRDEEEGNGIFTVDFLYPEDKPKIG